MVINGEASTHFLVSCDQTSFHTPWMREVLFLIKGASENINISPHRATVKAKSWVFVKEYCVVFKWGVELSSELFASFLMPFRWFRTSPNEEWSSRSSSLGSSRHNELHTLRACKEFPPHSIKLSALVGLAPKISWKIPTHQLCDSLHI